MRVLAALSGGVDSAVAAARAVEAGHEVVGVHMALTRQRAQTRSGSRGCCSIEDSADARWAAQVLGIPFYVWDLSEEFEERVVADFLDEYRAGRTPNPCVRCNERVKFDVLLERGLAMGFDAVATGHYARLSGGASAGRPGQTEDLVLRRAADGAKDQSYVLAVSGREGLSRALFPLGDAPSKAAVRAEADRLGLPVAGKPDSYDICFVADGDTRGFLASHLGSRPGALVSPDGEVLGEHSGYFGFTVGQRKGLGLTRPAPDGRPRYVIETRPQTNEVVVGPAELLTRRRIEASDLVLLAEAGPLAGPGERADLPTGTGLTGSGWRGVYVQVRAHGRPVPADVSVDAATGRLTAHLHEGLRGLAAGQSVVVYGGDPGDPAGQQVLAQATVSATA